MQPATRPEHPDPFGPDVLSVSGKRWVREAVDAARAEGIAQRFSLPMPLAELLAGRGLSDDGIEAWLEPTLRRHLPDPSVLTDLDTGAARVARAIMDGETIGVFGDYDVDGTTSAALLGRYFNHLEVAHHIHLPDRLTEGYGPNLPAFRGLQDKGATLCLTVDCGAMAHELLDELAQGGLDVVVVDHHQMTLPPPPAVAVVNPNRPDDVSGLGDLSAAGVTFMLLVGVSRALRRAGWFEAREEPPLRQWLDLVALGLVCDVMPLTGLTRVLVAQGLKVLGDLNEGTITGRSYPGLAMLAHRAGAKGAASAYHLGFVLGPRINAAGRVGHASSALKLLLEKDPASLAETAEYLHSLNAQRQDVEAGVLTDAMAAAEEMNDAAPDAPIVVSGEGWHSGVIGIVAGRLKEKFDRPVVVIGFDGDTGKGSGRSVSGVDLGKAIAAASRAGHLIGGGGHAMAAGLTIARDQLPGFQAFLAERLTPDITARDPVARLSVSGIVSLSGVTRSLCDSLEAAGPFGQGNPEPRWAIPDAIVSYADEKRGGHVAVTLVDDMGQKARAIAFRCAGEPLGRLLLSASGRRVHLVGRIRPDDWRGGEAAQLQIEDAMLA